MQLSHSFSALLAGVMVALSTVNEVQAVPTGPRMVSLPIKRMEQPRNVHPQILLQQQMNSAHKRLAKMSGRQAPTTDALFAALHKRVFEVEGDEGILMRREAYNAWRGAKNAALAKTGNEKRYNAWRGAKNAALAKAKVNRAADDIGGEASKVGVAVANPPTADNSLGLDIEVPDVGYLATVQMGTPPKPFLILMDSGSADLWVASEICQSVAGGDCGPHQTLGSQSSSTFTPSNTPFQVTYGTGAVSGAIIQDDINVAGLDLKQHTFGVAIQETEDFADDNVPFDGLMGLAQSTLSQQQTLTPVEALAKQGLISEAITSYKISRTADNKNDGEITFGGLDQTKFDPATLVTVDNVSQQGFWEADLDGASVNGQDAGLQGRTAILDTGTTLMLVPQDDAVAIHTLITGTQDAGNGQFVLPCDFTDKVALTFGGTAFEIDPRDIAVQEVSKDGDTAICLSGITGSDSFGANQWLVGDVFLKNAYFSTSVDKNTVSLATLV
ncbi:Acid protease [Mycena kentingensis (nom. inval.)]|nr:Acid protease [Mycena kentingensis (nom. inval.)]